MGVYPHRGRSKRRRFAAGRKAKFQCPVTGDVIRYTEAVRDWRGVWVSPDGLDERNPQDNVTVVSDPQMLHHPGPQLDEGEGTTFQDVGIWGFAPTSTTVGEEVVIGWGGDGREPFLYAFAGDREILADGDWDADAMVWKRDQNRHRPTFGWAV